MEAITGKIQHDLVVTENTRLTGMIIGTVTVKPGVHFDILGMVNGKLILEENSNVSISGMVNGDVYNNGNLQVYGMINGQIYTQKGVTQIAPKTVIKEHSL